MEYKVELNSIDHFKAWSGGASTLESVRKRGGTDQLTTLCEEVFSGTVPTEEEINDWLWFDDDSIFRSLGYTELLDE